MTPQIPVTPAPALPAPAPLDAARRAIARQRRIALALPVLLLAYLFHAAIAFDLAGVAGRARWDNAVTLMGDFWSYKVHVTRQNRDGARPEVSIEGMRQARFAPDQEPGWVTRRPDGGVDVALPAGNEVHIAADGAARLVVDGTAYDVAPRGDGIAFDIPGPPAWMNASDRRLTATLPGARVTFTRARTEILRRQAGWELFFFDLQSPFYGRSLPELARLAVAGPQLRPGTPNIAAMGQDFWRNGIWHHGDVAWAMFETVLMAFLGTMGAGLVALPLAFLAASNFTPARLVRQVARRGFDFLRGVDALIWTIVLSRAFGPGPLTGSLAILLTDTGSFGKLFSEALENVDGKPIEGLRSTGAGALARNRWAVMPQISPVILSQLLYFLESNTRSATVIGAITGGGIGLLLVQAIQTQKDWEHVAYYIVLIVLVVMLMDWLSGRLRARLIGERA
ncbi:phosphonate ABC transporter, permease protein PhnE [Paracoccus contaminans]|uniref:Phosphonate ABC transporter, permease protein PhnE n=1 Tax=Paracoccus contaminans TaxID=1945662 RepID=A0A1W6D0R3_9RHOB|nr:phosphonate ABC transporter, permease protein PhnE [Paracoccus contaminans]ARJ70714.1 phosphonate ABC transporter, permease protein PhnE [Paracoccus contaminans]